MNGIPPASLQSFSRISLQNHMKCCARATITSEIVH
jgi:hypothetical protein